jgi:hypothetical protein
MAGVIHQLWQPLLNTRCLSFRWTYAEPRAWIPQPFVSYSPNVTTGQHSVIFHSKCQIKYSYWLFRLILGGRNPADSIMVKPEAQTRPCACTPRHLQLHPRSMNILATDASNLDKIQPFMCKKASGIPSYTAVPTHPKFGPCRITPNRVTI